MYNKRILRWLENLFPTSTASPVQEAIFSVDSVRLKAQIQTLLIRSASFSDTAGENFYRGLHVGPLRPAWRHVPNLQGNPGTDTMTFS